MKKLLAALLVCFMVFNLCSCALVEIDSDMLMSIKSVLPENVYNMIKNMLDIMPQDFLGFDISDIDEMIYEFVLDMLPQEVKDEIIAYWWQHAKWEKF